MCPAVLQGTLFARRKAAAVVRGDAVLHKLFTEIAERYAEREGGYTRVLRSRRRNNDAAQMAFIECALQFSGASTVCAKRSVLTSVGLCSPVFVGALYAVPPADSCFTSVALPGSACLKGPARREKGGSEAVTSKSSSE